MATFTNEQQAAIDTYNRQRENAQSYGAWSQSMQKAALNQLKEAGVGLSGNGFFSLNTTSTTTPSTPTYTQPTQTTQPTQYSDNPSINYGDWNYGEDTDRRQQEIVNNLNEAYSQNPERFSDWSSFAQNYNYDYSGRSDMERETMRNRYEQNVQRQQQGNDARNVDYYLGILMNTGQLTGEGAAMDAARNRYRNYQYLSGMTPDQIASAIENNSINPVGQEMQDLKNYSPALYAQVQAAMQGQTQVNDINSLGEGIYNGLTSTETNKNYTNYNFTTEYAKNASVIRQYNESLYKKIEGLGGDTAAYVAIVASMLQNPLIQANKDEVENLEGEIRKIQENIYTVGDTARSKLGSEAPEDLVSAYISQQTKQLQNQLRTAQNSLLVAQGKLNNQLTEVETMIDAINNGIKMQASGMIGTPTQVIDMTPTTNYGGSGVGVGYTTTQSTPSYNYQDDSAERLQEIKDNLNRLYQTTPEAFKDRATFNEYFNYNKRSAKQKALLDSFWISKKGLLSGTAGRLSGTGTDTPSTSEVDTLAKAVKRDLLNNKIISFDSTSMKKQYPEYWNNSRGQDASYQVMVQIGKSCTPDDLSKLMVEVDDANDKALVSGYLTTMSSRIKKTGDGNTQAERDAATKLIDQVLDYITLSDIKQWLTDAGYSTKNINKVMKDYE